MLMVSPMPPGGSPIHGRTIEARFDATLMSSDGDRLALRGIKRRMGLAARLAGWVANPSAPERIVPRLDESIRLGLLMIAAGDENGNDSPRADTMFMLIMERLRDHGDPCSRPTVSGSKNLPERHAPRVSVARIPRP